MKITKNTTYRLFFAILLPIIFVGCKDYDKGSGGGSGNDSQPSFTSYRDVPGVTVDEAAAIRAFQEHNKKFTFGTALSTEAFITDNGEIDGYVALLCKWLTELFEIEFTPKIYGLSDMFAKLSAKELDFGIMMNSEERQNAYILSGTIGQRWVRMLRLEHSQDLNSIALTRPIRFAFMEGSIVYNMVSAVSDSGTFEAVFADNYDAGYNMLKRGEADAILIDDVKEAGFHKYDDVRLFNFLPQLFNTVTMGTGNPDLAPIASIVNKALKNDGYRYLAALYKSGYEEYRKHRFFTQLNEEERAYLQNTQVVPFASQYYNYPTSFYNTHEERWDGIVFDVLLEIEKLSGLSFKLVNDHNTALPEMMAMLEKGTAYMIPDLIPSKERLGRFIWPKTMFLSDQYALLSKSSYPKVDIHEIPYERVGLIRGSAFTEVFRNWFPDAQNTTEYPAVDDAFAGLNRGEVDLVMTGKNRLLTMINYFELSDYKANVLFDSRYYSSFGINKDMPVLCSIIDKTLRQIETEPIIDQWVTKTFDYQAELWRAQRPWLIGAGVLSAVIMTLAFILFFRSRGAGRYLEKLVKQRTSELELQTSLVHTMLDAIPNIIFCKDLNSNYTLCNKSMTDFFKLDKESIIGKGDVGGLGMPAAVAEGVRTVDLNVMGANKKIGFEESIPDANGNLRLFETVKAPLVQNGAVVGLVAVAHDITVRKKIENELALQTSTMQAIVDSIPGIVFCKDLNLVYTLCNKYAETYMRVDKNRIIGKRNEEGLKLPPEALEYVRVLEQKVIDENKKITYETIIPANDGSSSHLFEIIVAPLAIGNAVAGIIGVAHDITDRKAMEEEARAASRSKSTFLATMSHEIRTPMNSIMGFAELAYDIAETPQIKDYLNKITDGSRWLLRIINDILDISKIEAGKMEFERVPFDLREIFSRCQSVILPEIKEKALDLRIYAEPPPAGKKFLGDPVRLYQALINLLSNAVKFTSTGTVKFSSAIKKWDNGNASVYFEVKDSGIGMTTEQVDKIFAPFVQADSSTTRNYGGTGLGLAIAKNIVELMGGKLFVESAPGAGSTFSFEITLDTIETANEDTQSEEYSILEKPYFEGLILICDDNSMNQQVVCEHLSRIGLQTVVAENGKIGVEMVEERIRKNEKPFDLIFMDMFMPVMDGMEASAKVMALKTNTPIVAMTANIMTSEVEKYKKHGMPDCLGKPFTSQELWRVLLKYLKPVGVSAISKNDTANEDLQVKLRVNFVKNNQDIYTQINDAVVANDIKLAHRLAHTLKGSAGLIGKPKLQAAAAEVELILKGGTTSIWELKMNTLKAELTAVLEEFKPLLVEGAELETAWLDKEQTLALFEKLEPMLANINPECVDMIDDIRMVYEAEELVRQIENYDFETAFKTLGEMKGRIMEG